MGPICIFCNHPIGPKEPAGFKTLPTPLGYQGGDWYHLTCETLLILELPVDHGAVWYGIETRMRFGNSLMGRA